MNQPDYQSWVAYCFSKGMEEFRSPGATSLDSYYCLEGVAFGWRDSAHIPVPVVAEHMTHLFSEPDAIADRYSDAQISDGLWYIFGVASQYLPAIRVAGVSEEAQRDLIASLIPFYCRLLDKLCCQRGTDPSGEYVDVHAIDTAVFMVWDMIGFDAHGIDAGLFPAHSRPLRTLAFEVLATILNRCVTSSCQMSALHALGHLRNRYPRYCKPIFLDFLRQPEIAPCVRDYGAYARRGSVL